MSIETVHTKKQSKKDQVILELMCIQITKLLRKNDRL